MLRGYHQAIAYEAVPDVPLGYDGKPIAFYLTINWKNFNQAYKLFENGLKLGLDASGFHNIIQHWAFPVSYNDAIERRAWDIIDTKPKATTISPETKPVATDKGKEVSADTLAKPYTLTEGGARDTLNFISREKRFSSDQADRDISNSYKLFANPTLAYRKT